MKKASLKIKKATLNAARLHLASRFLEALISKSPLSVGYDGLENKDNAYFRHARGAVLYADALLEVINE